MFIAHGYCEHSGRYDKLARLLCSELQCIVLSHDHGNFIVMRCVSSFILYSNKGGVGDILYLNKFYIYIPRMHVCDVAY